MNDQLRKKSVVCASTLWLGVSTSMVASVVVAEEQFELEQQPTMLFDVGGEGSLTGNVNGITYEIVQGYAIAQGDMVLGRLFADGRLELPAQTRGFGQSGALERWPDGIIPYQFSDSVSQIQRNRALEAIAHWNTRTSIKLISRTAENEDDYKDYVTFEPSNGCASWVGRTGGEQAIWLADSCTVGSIIHEIGHAIGLFHEHTRPDRDNFVSVHWENVSNGKELNFEKIEVGTDSFSDYDYGSIMHYGEYFFSKNGERSITAPDGITIGQRVALSDRDARSVDLMYATDLKLDVTTAVAEANYRIDLLVTNIGSLGANTLELTASMGDNANWLSISPDSGWDCQQIDAELRCTRETLIERRDTSFSLLVDPQNASLDDLKVRLGSRTLDTELTNNVFNDSISAAESEEATVVAQVEETPESVPTLVTIDNTDNASDTSTASSSNTTASTSTANSTSTTSNTVTGNTSTAGGTANTDNAETTVPVGTIASSTVNNPPAVGAATAAETSGGGGGGAALHLLFLILFGRFLHSKRYH